MFYPLKAKGLKTGTTNLGSLFSRRRWLGLCVLGTTSLLKSQATGLAKPKRLFKICLNTATIRGQNLTFEEEIKIAAKAGYDSIEPWMDRIHQYLNRGGSLSDLQNQLQDAGLSIESAIAFPAWLSPDPAIRAKALESIKRDMDLLASIGGKRIAAPPAGIGTSQISISEAAERYYQLLEIGRQFGVVPQLEMWAGSPAIGRVSTAIAIAIETGHPDACFLGDIFHMYRAGCPIDGLRLLGPHALQVFHINDYPNQPASQLNDRDRLMPGDGVGPLVELLRLFIYIGARPVLSLELFNPMYWKQDPLEVARLGVQRLEDLMMKAMTRES